MAATSDAATSDEKAVAMKKRLQSVISDEHTYFYFIRPTLEEIRDAKRKHPREFAILVRMVAQKIPKTAQATFVESYKGMMGSAARTTAPLMPEREFKRMVYSFGLPSYAARYSGTAKELVVDHAYHRAVGLAMPTWYEPSAVNRRYLRYLFEYLLSAQVNGAATSNVLVATVATAIAAERERKMSLVDGLITLSKTAKSAMGVANSAYGKLEELQAIARYADENSSDVAEILTDALQHLDAGDVEKAKEAITQSRAALVGGGEEGESLFVGGRLETMGIESQVTMESKLVDLWNHFNVALNTAKRKLTYDVKPMVHVSQNDVETARDIFKAFIDSEEVRLVLAEPSAANVAAVDVDGVVEAAMGSPPPPSPVPESTVPAAPTSAVSTRPKLPYDLTDEEQLAIGPDPLKRIAARNKKRREMGIVAVTPRPKLKEEEEEEIPAATMSVPDISQLTVTGEETAAALDAPEVPELLATDLIGRLKQQQKMIRRARIASYAKKHHVTKTAAERAIYGYEFEAGERLQRAEEMKEVYIMQAEKRKAELAAAIAEKDRKMAAQREEHKRFQSMTVSEKEAYNREKQAEIDAANKLAREKFEASRAKAREVARRKRESREEAEKEESITTKKLKLLPKTAPETEETPQQKRVAIREEHMKKHPVSLREQMRHVPEISFATGVMVIPSLVRLRHATRAEKSKEGEKVRGDAGNELAAKHDLILSTIARSSGAPQYTEEEEEEAVVPVVTVPPPSKVSAIMIPEAIRSLTTMTSDAGAPTLQSEKLGWLEWLATVDLRKMTFEEIIDVITTSIFGTPEERWESMVGGGYEDECCGSGDDGELASHPDDDDGVGSHHHVDHICRWCRGPASWKCKSCASAYYCQHANCRMHFETVHWPVCRKLYYHHRF